MYYAHFGLTQPPFRITPNTEFFFGGGNRGPILEALIYAISQGEGIIKVTGEVGSGKTMLCNMLQSRLPPTVETAYIANPSVSPEEIVQAVALELHLKPPRDAGHLEVMQLIHEHLLERHASGRQVVMFVEESQSMPIATLEEIRLLSNLETANSKLLQIVLFGQPELEDNLRQTHIRQLRERMEGFRDGAYALALREASVLPRILDGRLPLAAAPALAIADPPDKRLATEAAPAGPLFTAHLRPAIEAARQEVLLVSPYFIPSEQGLALFSALHARGVRVRILTNSLAATDVPAVHTGYARVRERLL